MTAGVATLVLFEVPLRAEAPMLGPEEGRIQLGRLDDGSLILVPARELAPDEQVLLTVATEAGEEPLRFVLVTRRDAVDLRVRIVRPQASSDDDGAELVARSLLAAPDVRATLAIPQEVVEYSSRDSRGRVDSVLWMGRRFFVTVAVRSRKRGAPAWTLVRARLRAVLADGVLLEWPAHLLSGSPGERLQRHIVTGLLPEGSTRLELALDGEGAPGDFQPLSPAEAPAHP